MERVGFIGTGMMGRPMSLNLRKAGFPLVVFDRRPEAAREVVAAGAEFVDSSHAVAERSDIVITMLPAGSDVAEAVLGDHGVLAGAHRGMIVVDMSTIDPATTMRVAGACAEQGVAFLDAPVSGGVQGAIKGTLTIMVGGEAPAFDRARPVLTAMGSADHVLHLGPTGTGGIAKLVNQHLCATVAAATLEALVLGVKAGLDADTLSRVVGMSSGASWQLANPIKQRVLTGTFQPGFFMDLLVKDLNLVLEMGEQLEVPVALAATARQMYEAARTQGYGRQDYTAVVKPLEQRTGVEVRSRAETG